MLGGTGLFLGLLLGVVTGVGGSSIGLEADFDGESLFSLARATSSQRKNSQPVSRLAHV